VKKVEVATNALKLVLVDIKLVVRDTLGVVLTIYFFLAPLAKKLLGKTFSLVGTSIVLLLSLLVGD